MQAVDLTEDGYHEFGFLLRLGGFWYKSPWPASKQGKNGSGF